MDIRVTRHEPASLPTLLAIYLPPATLLIALVAIGKSTGSNIGPLFNDATAAAGVDPFTGAVSNLGIALWTATGAVCSFTALALRDVGGRARTVAFLVTAGLLTGVLLCDDLFMVHETVGPRYGVDELVIFAIFGAAFAGWVWWFAGEIIARGPLLLIIAVLMFGMSGVFDMLDEPMRSFGFNSVTLFEECFKLMGVAGWLGYFVVVCRDEIRHHAGPSADTSRAASTSDICWPSSRMAPTSSRRLQRLNR